MLAPGGCQSNLRFVYKLAGLATSFQKPAATSVFTLAVSGSAMRIGNARAPRRRIGRAPAYLRLRQCDLEPTCGSSVAK